jgi:hypothetical protein
MSLIYDVGTGNVYLENAPQPNPYIQRVSIASAGGVLETADLQYPATTPPVTVNSISSGLIDIEWSGGAFLGTGSFLGDIIPSSLTPAFLLADLTISYSASSAVPMEFGDLLHTSIPGSTQGNPILPQPAGSGFFRFFNVATGQFCDPPMASGYIYTMESPSLFTEVGFPYGLGDNFTIVSSEGTVTGLGEGDLHVFSGGVPTFTILGIDPPVNANDAAAFPVFLEFNTPTAFFNMQAIPEPGTLALLSLAFASAIGFVRRR